MFYTEIENLFKKLSLAEKKIANIDSIVYLARTAPTGGGSSVVMMFTKL